MFNIIPLFLCTDLNQEQRHNSIPIVFISYVREDSTTAERVYQELRNTGLNPWMDKQDILGGQKWENVIRQAIEGSRYFIPLFSSTSTKKGGYMKKEFKYALKIFEELPQSYVFVLPVRLDDCEIPYKKLKDIQYVDLFDNNWEEGIQKLLRSLEAKWDIGKTVGNNLEISFKTENVEIAYKKILERIESLKHCHITHKVQNTWIKANVGRKIAFRIKGYLLSDINEYPKKIFVDFNRKKLSLLMILVLVSDGLSGKLIQNMRATADMLRVTIENN